MNIDELIKANRADQIEQTIKDLEREAYRKSFYDFFIAATQVLEPQTRWRYNWHIQMLCDRVQQEVERMIRGEEKTYDLIINVPPRTSKSNIFSIILPVWVWIVFPECRLVTVSYAESLAVDHSTSSIRLLQTPWFIKLFPEVELSKDQISKSNYGNIRGGSRTAVGLFGAILGLTANILILDDPNNQTSSIELDNAVKTYKETNSRLADPSVDFRIIIQQRLASNDLTGWLLKNTPDLYEQICLPAELTDDVRPVELRQHYKDGLLWPERFSRKVLQAEREMKGSYGYNSQFLLRPADIGGGIIKRSWFDIIDSIPSGLQIGIFLDSAYTAKRTNDPSGILVCAFNPVDNCIYIIEVFQVWLEFTQLISKLKELGSRYANCRLFVEPKASGLSILSELRANTMLNVIELESPKSDKKSRANAITAKLESKRVKLVRGDWNELFLDEVSTFPVGVHDDLVDCLTYAVEKLLGNNDTFKYYMY